jgi:glycosyltransferase involved in cell wall biosynthesis
MARAMANRGHDAKIICNVSTEETVHKNIITHIVKPYLRESSQLPPSMTQNLRYIINSIIHGVKIVKNNKIDIIHTNSFTPIIAGSILGRLTDTPVIATIHDIFTNNELQGWSTWAKFNNLPSYYAQLGKWLEKISLTMHTDLYHAVSKATMHDIVGIKRDANIRVVYTGIDMSQYLADGYREYSNFILFIGRLVFYKNLDVLLKAFQYVLPSVPNAKLVIIGDGPMRSIWERMASEAGISKSVSFLGNVSTFEKKRLLETCAAVALPSIFEGFGLVLLEAFAMEKPVLVSNVSPFDEIVDDGLDGFILSSDDCTEWSEKIKYLLLNKEICKKMGQNGLPKVVQKFNFEKSVDEMESLYEEILLNHRH